MIVSPWNAKNSPRDRNGPQPASGSARICATPVSRGETGSSERLRYLIGWQSGIIEARLRLVTRSEQPVARKRGKRRNVSGSGETITINLPGSRIRRERPPPGREMRPETRSAQRKNGGHVCSVTSSRNLADCSRCFFPFLHLFSLVSLLFSSRRRRFRN